MKPWPNGKIPIVTCRKGDPEYTVTLTTGENTCWHCEHAIWVSIGSQRTMMSNPSRYLYLCAECAAAYVDESGQPLLVLNKTRWV